MKSPNTSSGSSTTCITAAAIAILAQLFASLYLSSSNAYASSVKDLKPPAAIVFGDSIVDPGNNNYLPTVGKCNFPPYGRDFEGGKPTGRYSNGKVPSDFIVEEFGIKELLPPYLDPTLQLNDLLTGVNFASGASGYDPLSAQSANVLSLTDQLRLFKEYKEKLKAGIGKDRTSNIISESLYAIFTGSNDITNTYYSTLLRRPYYNISAYTDLMIAYALRFFQELYDLGARKIGVTNLPPLGCLPSQRTLAGGPLRSCVEEYNQAAALFNSKLYSEIKSLNSQLPGSKITYLDIYSPLLSLINNPSKSGFEVVNKGCCGTGNIEVSILCNRYQPTTCTDDTKYIFWDSYHPTEKTYSIIVKQLINESYGSFF